MAHTSIVIKDNFLPPEEFEFLRGITEKPGFPWMLNPHSDEEGDNNPQFIHVMFENVYGSIHVSQSFEYLVPIINRLNVYNIIFAKLNLTTRLSKNDERRGKYHQDMPLEVLPKTYGNVVHTAVYYLNTNNGRTEFANGDYAESIANRLVTFPCGLHHRAVRHDEGDYHRIIFNINYVPLAEGA